MTIPLAVSPGTLTPGLYLKVNLVAGAAAASVGELRVLLIAPKSSSGDLTTDTEVRTGGGEASAGVAFGSGTPGHLAAKQLYSSLATAIVDFVAPVAGEGTAVSTITLSGAPTSNNSVVITLVGRTITVGWLTGEDASDCRDKIISAINALDDDMPVVASSGGSGIVTLTFKVAGRIGNDAKVKCALGETQTGTEAVTPTSTTSFTGGTTDPDVSNVLDASAGREYHYIVPCLSNTDAETTGSSSNVERILQEIEDANEGLDAKLQQVIYASTGTLSSATAAAVARNVGYCQHVLCINAGSLPCEFAGAEAGDRLYEIGLDPAANRIGNKIGTDLYGSDDITNDKPSTADCESAIGSGVSLTSYDAAENLIEVRPVTTFSQNSAGGADRRLLDTQNVDAAYIIARDLRSALPAEFPNAKIQEDSAAGSDPPPAGVIEERDVKTFVISRLRTWQRNGVILKSALDAAIEDETLAVAVNESDATQVDILVPIKVIPPLAKFGVVVNREPI